MKTTEGLLQPCKGIGLAGGQDLRCSNQQSRGQKLVSINPFQDEYQQD